MIAGAAFGRRVAAVHEAVDEHIAPRPRCFAIFEQRVQMRQLRMHAAVAAQAHQVQAVPARVLHRFEQHRILEELARRDHQVDARDVHVDHAAGADVQVAHFAVAHLSFRQPDNGPEV